MSDSTMWYDIIDRLIEADALPGRMMLWGPPGVGKSFWATSLRRAYRRITLTRGTQPEELIGMYTLQTDNGQAVTRWCDGPVITMMREGGIVVFDEIDHAGPELDGLLYAIGDDPAICAITLPTGEVVKPAKGFAVVATSNLPPSELAEPIIDRFCGGLILHCAQPHPRAIGALPNNLQGIATNHYARTAAQVEAWYAPLSYRSLAAYAHLREVLGDDFAARIIWGDDLGPDVVSSSVVASS